MSAYGLLLENPRRRGRRRTPPRGAGGRFRKKASSKRRRRNPGVVTTANPRRRRRRRRTTVAAAPRRRRASPRRKTTRRRRRNPGLGAILGGRGEWARAFNRGGQILVGEFVGDAVTRMATKFGGANLLAQLRIPPQFIQPTLRVAVGLLAPPLLKMAPRMFKPDFRATFAAVNVASGLIGLTMNLRTQLFSAAGLSDASVAYHLSDWETASGGVGDWETASGGVGGYELADGYGPPAGVLGEAPPAGVLDYDYL